MNNIYKLLDVTYKQTDKLYIVLIARNLETNSISPIFYHYKPYFYILKSDVVFVDLPYEETDYVTVNGEPVVRVFVDSPKLVVKYREELMFNRRRKQMYPVNIYEGNIEFAYRFLIDKNVTVLFKTVNGEIEPVENVEYSYDVVYIDVEVHAYMFPSKVTAPVVSVSVFDKDKILVWYLDSNIYTFNYEVPVITYPCNSEVELLTRFKEYLTNRRPDVIVSFSDFDMSYLIARMKQLNIPFADISPINKVLLKEVNHSVTVNNEGFLLQDTSFNVKVRIYGLQIIDYMKLYKKLYQPAFSSLDYIAKEVLNLSKKECNVYEDWLTDKRKVIDYNIWDVLLLFKIEDKLKLIEYYLKPIRHYTGLTFEDCLLNSKIGLNLYYRHCRKLKIVLPTYSFNKVREYQGAFVYCKKGMYCNVYQFDFSEMYPSIMETFHISFDTKNYQVGVKVNGVFFRTDKAGISNEVMIPLRMLRKTYKEQFKATGDVKFETLSFTIKQIVNSLYGLYGQCREVEDYSEYGTVTVESRTPLYDPDIAEAITKLAAEILKATIEYAKTKGYNIIYADTDSLFIENVNIEPQALHVELQAFVDNYIKTKYGLESKIKLSFEGVIDKMIVFTKKRYVAYVNGEMKFKGLEVIRRNSSIFMRNTITELCNLLTKTSNINDIVKFLEEKKMLVLNGKVPIEELALRPLCSKKSYKVLTENVKAIQLGRKYNCNITVGQRFYKVYLKTPEKVEAVTVTNGEARKTLIVSNVVGFDDVRKLKSFPQSKIDLATMYLKNVSPILKMLENLGYNVEKLRVKDLNFDLLSFCKV